MIVERAIVATASSAPWVALSTDAVAYVLEQVQMSRWLLERIDAGEQVDGAQVTRRAAALSALVEQLIDAVAMQGVAFKLTPEVERASLGQRLS